MPQHHNGGHNGGHNGSQHHHPGGHQHNPHHNPGHNNSHRCGRSFRGVNHRFDCYRRGWLGWTKRRWCRRLGCWLFWLPGCCWYQYYTIEGVYVPCDNLTDENCDD